MRSNPTHLQRCALYFSVIAVLGCAPRVRAGAEGTVAVATAMAAGAPAPRAASMAPADINALAAAHAKYQSLQEGKNAVLQPSRDPRPLTIAFLMAREYGNRLRAQFQTQYRHVSRISSP